MKTTVKKTYRDNEVECTVFADLTSLVEKVGEAAVLNLYQEYYLARTVGSKMDAAIEKEKKDGTAVFASFDLTAEMPTYGSRESGPRDGMSKFRTLAKSLLGSKASDEAINAKAEEIKAKLLG